MCGIVGITGQHNKGTLFSLRSAIDHRGPDDKGEFIDKWFFLGHTRLSILDLSPKGHQPMMSSDGNYIIIYNGEIYNHLEIRSEFLKEFSFKSISDTETLLYGFIKFGKDILNKLKGIFSFCIYNKTTGEVFIARDHFGIKPLYYYHKDNTFLFSSELKALVKFNKLDTSLCYESLVNYISIGWSPGESTPFAYVKKLQPGHYIEFNSKEPDKIKIRKYYDLPFNCKYSGRSEYELMNELEEKLIQAVKRQMLSDSPLAFFLSGGIDSSALVAIARKLYPEKKIQCFTIDTKDLHDSQGFSDDLKYAEVVAKHLNVDLEIVKLPQETGSNYEELIYHLDEPLADTAPLHVLAISKKAREMGYKVLISGTGADDIFSGYRRHQALSYEKYLQWIPAQFLEAFGKLLTLLKGKTAFLRRMKKMFGSSYTQKEDRLISYYFNLSPENAKRLFNEKIQKEVSSYNPFAFFKNILPNISEEKSDLNKMLYWEIKTYLPDLNLNYMDKMGMAAGVEIRVPFLDKDLVEFSCSVPPDLKMKGAETKYLLRELMKRYLPEEILTRSKTGFGIPPSQLIQGSLEKNIKEYLSDPEIEKRGIFNTTQIKKLVEDDKTGKRDTSYSILALLNLECWLRKFYDKKPFPNT